MQITGNLPTIMLDQVDGATIYLGPRSLGTEVFTSKCSGVNLNVLPTATTTTTTGGVGGTGAGKAAGIEDESEDWIECPIPEQIKSLIRNGKVVSEIVEHAG